MVQTLLQERNHYLSQLQNKFPALYAELKDDIHDLEKLILPPKYDHSVSNSQGRESKEYQNDPMPWPKDNNQPSAPDFFDLQNKQDISASAPYHPESKSAHPSNKADDYRSRLHELKGSPPEPSAPPFYGVEDKPHGSTDLYNAKESKSAMPSNGHDNLGEQNNAYKSALKSIQQEAKIAPAQPDEIDCELKEISTAISDIITNDSFDADQQEIAGILENQIAEIRQYANYDDVPNNIKTSFYENILILESICGDYQLSEKSKQLLEPNSRDLQARI